MEYCQVHPSSKVRKLVVYAGCPTIPEGILKQIRGYRGVLADPKLAGVPKRRYRTAGSMVLRPIVEGGNRSTTMLARLPVF